MYHCSKSVEEYHKDMEVALSRTNVLESNEATMARFLHGLNQDIQDIVEMSHYSTIDDLVHQRLSREYVWLQEEPTSAFPTIGTSHKNGSLPPLDRKEEGKLPNPIIASNNSSIKCFKCLGKEHIALYCPNKRNMVMKEDGTMDNASSTSKSSSKSKSDTSCDYSPNEGGGLLVRENILHSRCHVASKLCSIIIDSGSSVNVSSTKLVEKLKLPTLGHLKPYKLQWLNSEGEILTSYLEGLDNMTARVTNRFTFVHKGQKVIIKPVSPKQVNEGPAKMKLRREKEKKDRIEKKRRIQRDYVSKERSASKGQSISKGHSVSKGLWVSKQKNENVKENVKGKERLYVSKGVVKKMLLAKKEPLYLLSTNMCFHLSP
ncbi:hypothetical protein CR513_19256, partial [Mucuna pruriens]